MITITSLERRALIALTGLFALRMLGLFMIFPLFALYAKDLQGATPTLVGIALGAYGLTQSCLQIPFGILSDRVGRKPILFLGLLCFVLGSVVAAMSDSIHGVILGRLLQGASAIGGVIMALVTDLTPIPYRARIIGFIGLSIGLSFAAAMLLGPVLSAWLGMQGIFWTTALLGCFALILLISFVPQSAAPLSRTSASVWRDLYTVLKDLRCLSLALGVFALHASLVAVFLKIPGALNKAGYTEGTSWQFYAPVFLCALFSTIPWLMMSGRYHRPAALCTPILVLVLSQLGFCVVLDHLYGLALVLWLFFTAFNLLEAGLPALVSQFAPPALKGTAMGVYSSAQFLGLFMGGWIGGKLDNLYGAQAVFLGGLACTAISFLFFYRQCIRGSENGTRY
jgi:MFS family permease